MDEGITWYWVACTFLYALVELLAYALFLKPIMGGRSSSLKAVSVVLFAIVLCVLTEARVFEYFSWQYILVYGFILLTFLRVYTGFNVKMCCYYAIVITLATTFIRHGVAHASIMMFALNYLVEGNDWHMRLVFISLLGALYMLALWLLGRFAFKCRTEELSWLHIAVMVFAAFPAVYMTDLVTTVIRETGALWAKGPGPIVAEAACCLSGLAVVVGVESLGALRDKERELDYANRLIELQYRRYLDGQKTAEEINRKYHDIKRHVAAIERAESSSLRGEYIRALEDSLVDMKPQARTGSEILDAIVADEVTRCAECGLNLTCIADGALLSFMKPWDITTVVANLLDNAIEAASNADIVRLGDVQEEVQIRVAANGCGSVVIKVENACAEKNLGKGPNGIIDRNSLARSGAGRGYGLRNVAAAVESYGGNLVLQCVNGHFVATACIPLPEGLV